MNIIHGESATIANGGTNSGTIDCTDKVLVGFTLPTVTGTAWKLQHSDDGSTWVDAYDGADGTALARTVASSRSYSLPFSQIEGFYLLRMVMDAQGAARTIPLRFKPR